MGKIIVLLTGLRKRCCGRSELKKAAQKEVEI